VQGDVLAGCWVADRDGIEKVAGGRGREREIVAGRQSIGRCRRGRLLGVG
jgi:hypothetical protein